jgi:serine/threonine-protein kinase
MEGGFRPGTVLLEKYRVEGELGRGGMGVVLRVTHLHLGEELAVKILLPEAGGGPDVHARFLREAQSAVRLRGEHVARVGDVGVFPGGAPYMVMEYLRGGDLSGELARRGLLPPGEVVDYVLQACEALAEAHALGIVHRDIKPGNLFLTRRPDGSPLVKVLDFGISKAPLGGPGVLTRTDTVMGTPGYMSPEQMKASKDVDARSDIWALGIVLYECLNGRRPFDAETFSATVLRAVTEPPPPMDPRLPRGLQAVILHCLEKDRAARFPSTAALAAALVPFARDARSAGIIVERTAAMLRGPGALAVQAPRFDQRHATTLSGSAGMVRSRSTRRYAIGGGAVAVAAIVALSIAGLTASRPDQDATGSEGSAAVATISRPGPSRPVAVDATGAPPGASSVPDATEVAGTKTINAAVAAAPVAPARVGRAGSEVKAKAVQCAELEANRKWQDLMDCTTELATLAAQDRSVAGKVDDFRQKAIRETANSLAAGKVKDAIADGNLHEALQHLKTIGYNSVYFLDTSTSFRAAEARAVDDTRRQAQALATANDCAGIKHLEAQVDARGTPAVVATVAAAVAKCTARGSSPPSNAAPAQAGKPAPARGSFPPSNAAPTPSDSPFLPTETRGLSPPSNATPAPSGDQVSAASKSFCEVWTMDEVMTQAQHQYAAGFLKSALQLATKALACKQDVRMYRLAATYACAAHDETAAKQFFGKVPPQFQVAIVQRCQQEGILLQGP